MKTDLPNIHNAIKNVVLNGNRVSLQTLNYQLEEKLQQLSKRAHCRSTEIKQAELSQRETKIRKREEEVKVRERMIEDSKNARTWLKVFPLVKYKDFTLAPWPCNEENPGKHLQLLKEFDSWNSDIMLCTSPKSGTHWLHEIIYMLSRQTTEYCPQSLFTTHMDMMGDFDSLESQSEPRILHTHLPFSFLPTKHVENGRKIVFVNRNPKDRHVSLYNFLLGKMGVPEDYSWNDYFDEMVLHDTLYKGWFNYTKEFLEAVDKNPTNIIHLLYEDILKNPTKELTRLAEFLEIPKIENLVAGVVDKCSFNKLKENKVMPFRVKGKPSSLFRKGKIGDWKNWFTVTQNEQFDAIYRNEMKNVNISFSYE
ncbi:SULT1 [Mytilus edulis]|uniref:SULT1 n=1 Tax=Mytilus edulis TaxID=6550 RepID=A0A8S3T4V8_MYTED|nr:SULT1 [Mytilus edulis]